MTYLEALRMALMKIVRSTDVMDVVKYACPKDTEGVGVGECGNMDCLDCWNREMPEPPKEEDE